jgi:hypothetical protein
MMKIRMFYRDIDAEDEAHPVDELVEARLATRATRRRLAERASGIMRALGPESKLWLAFEEDKAVLERAREEAYFDVGVEHGLAVAHANELDEPRRRVKELAQHLLREAMASGLEREDAAAAASLVTWSLLGRLNVTRRQRG